MIEPTYLELATYINDLEQSLADSGYPCRTDEHLLKVVRPWMQHVVDANGSTELPWKVADVD